MKKVIVLAPLALAASLFLTGCIGIGNRSDLRSSDSVGKQLIELKKAQGLGAINEAEFQTLKAKLLGNK
jgi:hypothetical protein